MKRNILILSIAFLSFMMVAAGNWQKKYFVDDFGEPDYSKPCYVLHTVNSDGFTDWILDICYVNGVFVLRPCLLSEIGVEINSLRAKDSQGNIYKFKFYRPNKSSFDFYIKDATDINTLMNLLEKGYFTLSFHTPGDQYHQAYNYNYKIRTEGNGIRSLSGRTTRPRQSTNSNQGSSRSTNRGMLSHEAQGQPDTYKGSVGKYPITMQLKAGVSSQSNPHVFPVSGKYWYGKGTNGKMTLKGTLQYKDGGIGVYKLVEYDPNGKKCGSFQLNEKTNINTYQTIMNGTMTNAKGTTYNVNLKKQ